VTWHFFFGETTLAVPTGRRAAAAMTPRTETAEACTSLPAVGLRTASLALMTAALWGGNPAAVSFSLDAFPPIFAAGLRFALASVFMLVWCRVEGSRLQLEPGQWVPCLVAGFGLFVQIGTFNWGLSLTSSSHASMLVNTFIFWILVIEHFITRTDRITGRKTIGLLLAFAGVVLILSTEATGGGAVDQRDQPTLPGDLILLLSGLLLAWKVVYIKHALQRVEPGKLILWHDVFGTLMFFAWSLLTEHIVFGRMDAVATVAILYQGILVGGVCFAVQTMLLRRHSASQIAVFNFAAPVFGVLSGVLLRGDRLTPWLFVAAACVAAGILLVNLARRPAARLAR